jgi:hypothetical protein
MALCGDVLLWTCCFEHDDDDDDVALSTHVLGTCGMVSLILSGTGCVTAAAVLSQIHTSVLMSSTNVLLMPVDCLKQRSDTVKECAGVVWADLECVGRQLMGVRQCQHLAGAAAVLWLSITSDRWVLTFF